MSSVDSPGAAFARQLQKLMEERGVTRLQLAQAIGVSQASIFHYLNGRFPRPQVLVKLAEFFQVDARDFLKPTISALVASQTTDAQIEVTSADREQGFLYAPLKYHRGSPPPSYPEKIKLTRPNWQQAMKLLEQYSENGKLDNILMACLPQDRRNDQFLNQLTVFCIMALMNAAYELTFGEHPPSGKPPSGTEKS